MITRPKHILLAEDDADDRELFLEAIALVDPSIRLATVENGEQLMDRLRDPALIPDCIFLDLNMPKKNGKECLFEIRQDNRTKEVPVIIYTTSLNARDIDETYSRGASRFIRKPNTFGELISLLDICMKSAFKVRHHPIRQNFVLNL